MGDAQDNASLGGIKINVVMSPASELSYSLRDARADAGGDKDAGMPNGRRHI